MNAEVDKIDLFERRKMWVPGKTFSLSSERFKVKKKALNSDRLIRE